MEFTENRFLMLLRYIIEHPESSILALSSKFGCSERQINYDISKINRFLASKGIDSIKIAKRKVLISEQTIKKALELTREQNREYCYIDGEHRLFFMCIMMFCVSETLSIASFMITFKVSKGTVIGDLKKLALKAEEYDVKIEYSRQKGYYLSGSQLRIRSLVLFSIYKIRENLLSLKLISKVINTPDYIQKNNEIRNRLNSFVKENNVSVISDYMEQVIYMTSLLSYYVKSSKYKCQTVVEEETRWKRYSLYSKINDCFNSLPQALPKEEQGYFFVLIISMTAACDGFDYIYNMESHFLYKMAEALVGRFEVITCTIFTKKELLIKNLIMHLRSAYFRLKYGMAIVNPMLNQIKEEYKDIFHKVKLVLSPLEQYVNTPIPEDEIGYITIHFLAMVDDIDHIRNKKLKGIVICHNGLGASAMLKHQLQEMFPEIVFENIYSLDDVSSIGANIIADIIFTTVPFKLNNNIPIFVVPPLISAAERISISWDVYYKVFGVMRQAINVSNLINIIEEYAHITNYEGLKNSLYNVLSNQFKNERKDNLPMLKDLITAETIQFVESVGDWTEAIRLGAKPLVENGSVQQEYVEACIENVKTYGPYIVITKNIALPHAQDRTGVNKVAMSFLHLEQPVKILDDDECEVTILITLATPDNNSHLRALADLTTILTDEDKKQRLIDSKNFQEVLKIIDEVKV